MGIVQRDSFRITIIAFAGAAIGYLNKVFLFPNFLETDQVGLANLLISIALMYSQVASLGSNNIIIRFFPFFKDQPNHNHGFLFAMFAFATAGFIIVTTVAIALQHPLYLIYHKNSPLLIDYAWYLIPLALASLYFNLFDSYLRCLFRTVFASFVYDVALRLFITITILMFAFGFLSFPGFVTIYVIANCLPSLIVILYTALIRSLLMKPMVTPLIKRFAWIMLIYGLYSLLNNLSFLILSGIDSLMVAAMINLSAAGIYTTMIFVTSVILMPHRAVLKVSGPIIANYWKNRAMEQMGKLYRQVTSSNLVIGSGLFMLIWVNLDSIFHFMPAEYSQGKYVFLFLGIGRLFEMTSGLSGTILLTSKRYRVDFYFTLGLLIVIVATNLIFIPVFGINGAAFASMISLVLYNLLRIWFIQIHLRIHPFEPRQLFVPIILLIIIAVSELSGRIPNVFADVAVRSFLTSVAFILPVFALKISEDINQFVISYLNRLTTLLRPTKK